jgi:hypothetical protein
MSKKPSSAAGGDSFFQHFATISDSELVTEILDDRTRRDACPGFSAFIGTTTKRRLQGVHAKRLADAGLDANAYLAIRWWCLLFIPLVPLSAAAIADYRSIDEPFSDPHSRAFPVAMDWRIAGIQAAVGLATVALLAAIGFAVVAG